MISHTKRFESLETYLQNSYDPQKLMFNHNGSNSVPYDLNYTWMVLTGPFIKWWPMGHSRHFFFEQ